MKKEHSENTNQYCNKCGCELGWFFKPFTESKKNKNGGRKKYLFSHKDLDFLGKKYRRILCIDCFYEKHSRYPSHMPSLDFYDLYGIPEEDILEKREEYKATKKNLVRKYGEEEGGIRWEKYCNRQAETNSFEYKNEKYGMSKKEFDEYNKSRAITLENMIKKYGKKEGTRRYEEYCNKQAYVGCKREYFIEKYGLQEGIAFYNELNSKKALSKRNFIKKYGENEGIIRWESFKEKTGNRINSKSLSGASQKFFWELLDFIPQNLRASCKFGELNSEYSVDDTRTDTTKYYDFVIQDIKMCIEFNGDFWHANPRYYKGEEILNHFGVQVKAIDLWRKDLYKKKLIEAEGYRVLYVWEYDVRNSKESVIKRIMEKLYERSKDFK